MPEISHIKPKDDYSSKEKTLEIPVENQTKKIGFFRKIWEWATKDKARIGSLIFIFLFIVIIIILAIFGTNLGDILSRIIDWFEDKIGLMGIFIGVFIISIFGNFTVIFPVPYTFALVAIATRDYVKFYHIIIMGLFAGAGAAIGETSAWLFGKASKQVIEEGMEKQVNQAKKWIEKGLAPLIIFIFAATPLPDDAVLIFIGLLGYSLWKTLIWCFLGKIILTTFTGLFTKLFVETSFGEKLLWLFGLSSENGEISVPDPKIWQSALVWFISIILIGIILFIDWSEIWNKITSIFYKRKIIKLLDLSETQKLDENKIKGAKGTSVAFILEDHFWQCSTYDKKMSFNSEIDLEKNLNYFGLLSVSYAVNKPIAVHTEIFWYDKVKLDENSGFPFTITHNNIWQMKSPNENNIDEDILQNKKLPSKSELISIWLKDTRFKKEFNFNYLVERENDRIRIDCIGENEAKAIKLIKKFSRELVLSKLINYLEQLEKHGEKVTKLTISKENALENNIITNNFKE